MALPVRHTLCNFLPPTSYASRPGLKSILNTVLCEPARNAFACLIKHARFISRLFATCNFTAGRCAGNTGE